MYYYLPNQYFRPSDGPAVRTLFMNLKAIAILALISVNQFKENIFAPFFISFLHSVNCF